MAPSVTPLTTHYALVIDAGSSGSRLQIYSWRDPDLERAEILQDVKNIERQGSSSSSRGGGRWWWDGEDGWKGKGKGKGKEMEEMALRRLVRVGKGVEGDDWMKRVEPGISTVDPDNIPEYLAPLLTHALQHIPPSVHSSTPIYVLATAGMRLLPSQQRDAILQATCDTLRNDYPFLVPGPTEEGPCGENVRVIDGEEEGIWGWVAVNYLMDGFGHAPSPSSISNPGTSSSSSTNLLPLAPLASAPPDSSSSSITPVDIAHHSPTFGFLDMGGASTQLAFSPSASELLTSGFPLDKLRTVSLRLLSGEQVDWPVFVASWLGFGTNRARERYMTSLYEEWAAAHPSPSAQDLATPIPDPCLPKNLTITPSLSSQPPLIGTGSFPECLTSLHPLLEHSTPCPTSHCLFGGQPTPHIDFERHDQRGFIGISEYWYTMQHVLGVGGVWDWGEWEKGMKEFCGKEWGLIKGEMENGDWEDVNMDSTRLEMQCFKGAWISNVLHEGIGIPRLVDVGGNDTLTGGSLGDTNAEAERRAREKGLFEGSGQEQGKHHFQSMDQVGETAISWTLGKVVIEASKAVQPRSQEMEGWWMHHLNLGSMRLPLSLPIPKHLEGKLEDLGLSAVWVYAVVAFFLVGMLFSRSNRRRGVGSSGSGMGRRRKPSLSSPPLPARPWFTFPSFFSAPPADPSLSIEDGPDSSPTSSTSSASFSGSGTGGASGKSRIVPGRLRLWSLRISNTINKYLPPSLPFSLGNSNPRQRGGTRELWTGIGLGLPRARHNSMPMIGMGLNTSPGAGLLSPSGGGGYSQPGSPRPVSTPFFSSVAAPGIGGLNMGVGSLTPETALTGISSATSVSPSPSLASTSSPPPPRSSLKSGKSGRPFKSRQNSNNLHPHHGPHGLHSVGEGIGLGGGGAGWNDPPLAMLSGPSSGPGPSGSGAADDGGVLTPTANGGLSNGALSRNSSRANLSELGLAQRSMSRTGTPGFD